MKRADFTAADARRLYWQNNELTSDGRLAVPDSEVEVSHYFTTEQGDNIFELKDALTGSTIDFVYSDGTSADADLPVFEDDSSPATDAPMDISMADVLGTKTKTN